MTLRYTVVKYAYRTVQFFFDGLTRQFIFLIMLVGRTMCRSLNQALKLLFIGAYRTIDRERNRQTRQYPPKTLATLRSGLHKVLVRD
jgi:hypothetical protein